MNRSRPVLWSIAVIIVIGLCVGAYVALGPSAMGFAGGNQVALRNYGGNPPSGVPMEMKSASQIEKGEYLTRAADCMVCHTAKGGTPYSGGRGFVLPFGTIYSTNITPDAETGIGYYTDQDFLKAMHKGIGRDGMRLYPAMPFASYTFMSDEDALAIKAYL